MGSLLEALSDKGKAASNKRAGALAGMGALLAQEAVAKSAEYYIAASLGDIIDAMADKTKPVVIEAEKVGKSLVKAISPYAVSSVMPALLAERGGKWQCNLYRCEALSILATRCPLQMRRCMTDAIPVVSDMMWDTKAQVKAAATQAMADVTSADNNKDVKQFVPEIIKCILDPTQVPECVHKLAGVVFVQDIEASTLALMSPLLKRGFDEPVTVTKRNCARIVENMSKLVDDPYEVAPFVPLLLPALERAKEEVSDPECRNVCGKAHEQLSRTANKPPVWKRIEVAQVATTLSELVGKVDEKAVKYASSLAHMMLDLKNIDQAEWLALLSPYLATVLDGAKVTDTITKLLEVCAKQVQIEEEKEEADDAEQLCDCQFSLAYGNKVLLNQTKLKLKRGFRYALCGKNDSGKTSLMRAIANQQVDGFPPPTELRTMFVETDVQGEHAEIPVLEYVVNHEGLKAYGITEEMAREKLLSVGFDVDDSKMAAASLTKQVGRLSGGWRMKLALVRAMLMKADILLLDEPTNHLDPGNVKWVCDYLTSLTAVTSIIVSHDIKVLDQVCTHLIQIDNLKLKLFKGTLTDVATNHVPDLMSYFELKATKFKMNFPQPGNLEGITSKGKHIMKMTNITFTYPGAPKPQLTGVTVRISLSTRAACIGANGAGKSTMIKLLTGELQPDKGSGDVWKHPNARVAYVAQHAFHHIENHLEMTPNEYIRWRYEHGADKEGLEKVNQKMTDEEEAAIKKPIAIEIKRDDGTVMTTKAVFKRFTEGRRKESKGKDLEYEIKWQSDTTSWVSKTRLIAAGFAKLLNAVDESIAARATQLVRPLTQQFVENHLNDVGLEPEFATHSRIGALSGGQKVKVVLAAALWNTPHIVILDEPTNYLDRDSLGAMAEAIRGYEGGVVIISHNAQFVDQVCPEVWHLENHTLNLKGSYDWLESANKEAAKLAKQEDTYIDGLGNEVKVEKAKKPPSKAELKKIRKAIADKRKHGEEVWTDEEIEAAGFLVQ
jgi:elongation factor 3